MKKAKSKEPSGAPGRGDNAAGGGVPRIQSTPLGPEYFVRTEDLLEALRGVGDIGADRFFEEIDAVVDPTSRYWPDCES